MRLDLTGLTEVDVRDMDETIILDLDERMDLRSVLVERLNALPRDRFMTVYASCLADLRDFYDDRIDGAVLALVNRTIGLADHEDAADVLGRWNHLFGLADDSDRLDVIGDEFETIEGACIAFAGEVAHGQAAGAAQALAYCAEQAYGDEEPGVNIRWMLRFSVRAESARPDI